MKRFSEVSLNFCLAQRLGWKIAPSEKESHRSIPLHSKSTGTPRKFHWIFTKIPGKKLFPQRFHIQIPKKISSTPISKGNSLCYLFGSAEVLWPLVTATRWAPKVEQWACWGCVEVYWGHPPPEQWKKGPWLFRVFRGLYYPVIWGL